MARNGESRTLGSTAEVMTALDGITGVMKLTGAPYKRVWEWDKDRTFPSKYFAVMDWALRKKRLRAPPSLWGQVTVPEMQKVAA